MERQRGKRDPMVEDALHSVEELYRLLAHNEKTSLASGETDAPDALLPLQDLCHDTLRVVNDVPGYSGASSTLPTASDEDHHEANVRKACAGATMIPGYAPLSPQSCDQGGTAFLDDNEHHERSPLKAGNRHSSRAPLSGRRRFSKTPPIPARRPPSWLSALLIFSHGNRQRKTSVEQESASPEAPLVEIQAVFGSDAVPEGFKRVSNTPCGRKADLNAGAGGHYIYLAVRKDNPGRRRPPVVALAVIFPDRQEFVPPTFSVVRRQGEPVDFNAGTHGERVYLCYKRGAGNPIIDIQVIFSPKKESPPLGYTLLARTPFKYEADLNAGGASSNTTIFICYKQHLRNVNQLRQRENAVARFSLPSSAQTEDGYPPGTDGEGGPGWSPATTSSYESLLTGPVVSLATARKGWESHRCFSHHGENDVFLSGASSIAATTGLDSNLSESSAEGAHATSGHNKDTHAAGSPSRSLGLEDDPHALAPSGALDDLWSDADLRPRQGLPPPTENARADTIGEEDEEKAFLRRTLLTPLLVALYTGNGQVTAVALRGLVGVATRHMGAEADGHKHRERSACPLQAFVIESLCFFVHRVQVEHFDTVVQYLRHVIQAASVGDVDLSSQTLQQIFTTCVFLCNFEAFRALENERHARYAAVSASKGNSKAMLDAMGVTTGAIATNVSSHWSFGREMPALGVDCSAFLTLRLLIEGILRRVEVRAGGIEGLAGRRAVGVAGSAGTAKRTPVPAETIARSLVLDVVAAAIQFVELTKATQRAVDCIKRGSASSHESFWKELLTVSAMITRSQAEENAFLLLAAICKLASEAPRTALAGTGQLVARDVAAKLLALELLSTLLKKAGERFQSSPLFGTQVRRLVVSTLLSNVATGLQDLSVQRRVLSLITLLWRMYRRWCKIECGFLLDAALLQPLRFPPSLMLVARQTAVVNELMHWLEIFPQCLVELYLNFDLDRKSYLSVQQPLPAFEETVAAVCGLGEDLGGHLVAHDEETEMKVLHVRTLATVAQLTRSLMNASGHAHLISLDAKIREISLSNQPGQGGGGWEHDVMVLPSAYGEVFRGKQQIGSFPFPSDPAPGAGQPIPLPLPPPLTLPAMPPPALVIPPSQPLAAFTGKSSAGVEKEEGPRPIETWDKDTEEYIWKGRPQVSVHVEGDGTDSPRAHSPGKQTGQKATKTRTEEALDGSPRRSAGGFRSMTPTGRGTRRTTLLSRLGSDVSAATPAAPAASLSCSHSSPSLPLATRVAGEGPSSTGSASPTLPQASSVRVRQEQQRKQEEVLTQALSLYRAKGLKKAVQYLVASSFMSDTPRDVASFLRVYRDLLDPEAIGDYLGEGGHAHDAAYWSLLRLSYVRAVSFHNMTLEQALRHFLTRCGFRLPGEAQKIDRLISVFAECYFQDNQGMPCCPFSQPDTPYILSYAIIILQTDLHKVGGQKRGRGKVNKPMTKEAFINNLRGVDESPDLTREYLSEIYESISHHPIEMNLMVMQVGGGGTGGGSGRGDSRAHQLHPQASGGRGNSGGGGGYYHHQHDSVPPAWGGFTSLRMHDSRTGDEEGSDAGVGKGGGGGGLDATLCHARREVSQVVRDADELLRGLAVYPNSFAFVGVNANLTPDLVKLMFESVWFHVHGLAHAVLQNPTQSDPEPIMTCLDIVQHMLCAAMFLNLRPQRQAFASLLAKFKWEQERMAFGFAGLEASRGGAGAAGMVDHAAPLPGVMGSAVTEQVSANGGGGGVRKSGAFESSRQLTANAPGNSGRRQSGGGAWDAINEVHSLVADLKDSVQQSRLREELKAVAKRIEARAKLLEGSRRFLREGELVKKCRSGKRKLYTFFLFSDQLLYTHRGFAGEFKVHQQLLLSLTKVSNVEDRRNCSFQIHHPQKSFVVVADSPEMKRVWMRDIQEARNLCRKSVVETQLSVIASLKTESAGLMALLEGRADEALLGNAREASGAYNPTSAPANLPSRAPLTGGASTSSQSEEEQHRQPPLGSSFSTDLSSQAGGGGSRAGLGRPRGRGSSLSASSSSDVPSSLRLQDVELEALFCDGLRALNQRVRDKLSSDGKDDSIDRRAFPLARSPSFGNGKSKSDGGLGAGREKTASPSLDDQALATAVGLFLQYREGDYGHHDQPPTLAALAALGMGNRTEGVRKSSRRSPVFALALKAWKANAGLSQTAAMTRFLEVLEEAMPGWKDEASFTPERYFDMNATGAAPYGDTLVEGGGQQQFGRSRATKKLTPRGPGGWKV
ncbi:hypothetical protein NSK_001650 [Nannochloropsis salina CCMP1776]|uniref:SEC7 domain-containing protein n=1 Tax=Nannochloropsis salina CCMP1776 TaxID=1027361 RepID=A0A4D9DF19_9STRA|nr:hypothetical protein NSK_001650 [Nannochloropsis salina CCMP1776]|eukprot:TFJ87318.1 hypothetical protein NSK_001650 [Nannochloropsis salina CCMP1776]